MFHILLIRKKYPNTNMDTSHFKSSYANKQKEDHANHQAI